MDPLEGSYFKFAIVNSTAAATVPTLLWVAAMLAEPASDEEDLPIASRSFYQQAPYSF